MAGVAELITRLNHQNPSQRRMAALRLGALPDAVIAPILVDKITTEPDFGVREDLTWAIVMHIDQARPAVEAMLASELPASRAIAAHVLSKVGDPRDFVRVAALVADPNPDVAVKAYRAAANTGGVQALPSLLARLGDGDQAQRDMLTIVLVALGGPALLGVLARFDDASADVRHHAVEAAGRFGDTVALDVLAALALDRISARTGDDDRQVRVAAVCALDELGAPGRPTLTQLSASEDALVAEVARRLLASNRRR